jgi:7,8-dihydroneopterin aldolase/epimerase/oxygenase
VSRSEPRFCQSGAPVSPVHPLAYNRRHSPNARNRHMDTVMIESLGVDTVIGVHDWERRLTQRLVIDLELATDIRPAAAADDIALTLDYAAISERVAAFAAESDFALVETFAERLASALREAFAVSWLRLTVRKPGAVPAAAAVGVRIERGEGPGGRG